MDDFIIRLGVPEIQNLWDELCEKDEKGALDANEHALLGKLVKAFRLLEKNPRHPGLNSHEINSLTRRYGRKVWQSYLENRKPAAGRLFWVYGPENRQISIIGIEPHPDSGKAKGYGSVTLSKLPPPS